MCWEATLKELLLVLALILSVAWLVLRIRRGRAELQEVRPGKAMTETSAFHAISIKYSRDACDAAKALTGRRFLSSEPPRLPLPGCDGRDCHCQFNHHSDRRSGSERRSPFNPGTIPSGTGIHNVERRQGKDRREDISSS